jgi:hypothetical protein
MNESPCLNALRTSRYGVMAWEQGVTLVERRVIMFSDHVKKRFQLPASHATTYATHQANTLVIHYRLCALTLAR